MKIGSLEITKCKDCPAYKWAGESSKTGNAGFYCDFDEVKVEENSIPPNCPLKDLEEDSTVLSNYHNAPDWLKHYPKAVGGFPNFVYYLIKLKEEFERDYTKDGLGLVEENLKLRNELEEKNESIKKMDSFIDQLHSQC